MFDHARFFCRKRENDSKQWFSGRFCRTALVIGALQGRLSSICSKTGHEQSPAARRAKKNGPQKWTGMPQDRGQRRKTWRTEGRDIWVKLISGLSRRYRKPGFSHNLVSGPHFLWQVFCQIFRGKVYSERLFTLWQQVFEILPWLF